MTIAQQLKIEEFPFVINNNRGKEIYYEEKYGFWCKREYDDKGNEIYYKNSDGYWSKREYDDNGNEIYTEDSGGYIDDKRPKPVPEYTMEELVDKLGHNFKIKK